MMLSYVRRTLAITLGLGVLRMTSGCSLHLDEIDRELAEKAKNAGEISDASRTGAPDAAELGRDIDATGGGPIISDASGAGSDASLTDSEGRPEAPSNDANPVVSPEAGCSRDSDCPVNLAQCKASLCKGGICSTPTAYRLLASQFTIAGPPRAGLAGHRNELIAAIYPYLFVVNAGGVAAFNVSNPKSASPRPVRIDGLPSTPVVAVMAVGKVVYFVGSSTTANNGALQPLSWIDVSSDGAVSPEGDVLHANVPLSVFIEPPLMPLQRPTKIDSLYNVLPSRPDGLFLVYSSSDHPTYFPTALLKRPGTTVTVAPYWNQALVTGADVAAASGSRLVAYTSDGPQPKFALVTMPGTSAASVGSQVTVPTMTAAQSAFASSPAGGVLWTSAVLTQGANTAIPGVITAARLTLLLADENTATLSAIAKVDPMTYFDLQQYAAGIAASQVVVAPPVWISSSLALGLSAEPTDPLGKTLVRLISVEGSNLSANSDAQVLPSPPATIDIASSNGFAYALGADATSNTVYVLAPSCSINCGTSKLRERRAGLGFKRVLGPNVERIGASSHGVTRSPIAAQATADRLHHGLEMIENGRFPSDRRVQRDQERTGAVNGRRVRVDRFDALRFDQARDRSRHLGGAQVRQRGESLFGERTFAVHERPKDFVETFFGAKLTKRPQLVFGRCPIDCARADKIPDRCRKGREGHRESAPLRRPRNVLGCRRGWSSSFREGT